MRERPKYQELTKTVGLQGTPGCVEDAPVEVPALAPAAHTVLPSAGSQASSTAPVPASAPPVSMRERADTPSSVRDWRIVIRTAMAAGVRVRRDGDRFTLDGPQGALASSLRRALTSYAQCQEILESCYVLGPILPGCGVCGELRMWLDRDMDEWRCWTCIPPRLRTVTTTGEL
jgi:hypothetical protein